MFGTIIALLHTVVTCKYCAYEADPTDTFDYLRDSDLFSLYYCIKPKKMREPQGPLIFLCSGHAPQSAAGTHNS